MRERITTFGELLGAAIFASGVFMFSPALGLIAAGALLMCACWLVAR